jgi:hypothetical protein
VATTEQQLIGWREWITLTDFDATRIKVKVDTGAKTSALHTYYVTPFERNGEAWVRFGLHPLQGCTTSSIECEAPIKDRRQVTDSGGHREWRFVIETTVQLKDRQFPIEITLTDRENMRFRMLLGRSALRQGYVVDSAKSFVLGGSKSEPPV